MGLAPTNLNLGAPSNASLGPLEPEAEAREANPRLPEDLLHPASAWKIGKPEVRASILPGFKVQWWGGNGRRTPKCPTFQVKPWGFARRGEPTPQVARRALMA